LIGKKPLSGIGRRHLVVAVSAVFLAGGVLVGGAMAWASTTHSRSATTTTTTVPGVPWPSKTSKLYLYVDTDAAATEGVYGDCQQGSYFDQGQMVLFRVAGTLEPAGVALTPSNIRVMSVDIPGVKSIPLVWGTHNFGVKKGAKAPQYWTAAWSVPKKFPLGVVNFYIHVVALKSKTSTDSLVWTQIPITASDLTIVTASNKSF